MDCRSRQASHANVEINSLSLYAWVHDYPTGIGHSDVFGKIPAPGVFLAHGLRYHPGNNGIRRRNSGCIQGLLKFNITAMNVPDNQGPHLL